MQDVTAKRCLVLSNGPIPTPEQTKVEGGGLRCWGLAKGLHANDKNMDITVAYHESYRKEQFTETYEDIKVTTWSMDGVAELIQDYDTVLVSYCMGELSVRVADAIRSDQQLVLDCYVPIYVEVSARDTSDVEGEYHAFHGDVGRWAHVLRRGDLFLCSSEAQKKYYKGVLSAIGRINPATYGHELLRVVPYGIYRQEPVATEKPITKIIGKGADGVQKILWFGGIYPWFDLRNLVDAIKKLNQNVPARLVIVGAKNPFNNHPDFVRPYNELMAHIEADKQLQELVIVQDWVEFDKRADWYLDSDLVVVVNKLGEENELAWRTRLVDFMWADLPIITNGGDPLGEELLTHNAAARLHGLSSDKIASDMQQLLENKKELQTVQTNLKSLKKHYYWDVATKQLTKDVVAHVRAADLDKFGDRHVVIAPPTTTRGKVKKAINKARMLPAYARKYGLHNTYFAVRTTIGNQFKKANVGHRTEPGVIMIAHQLDNSGAPYVFLDLARSILQEQPATKLEFHTFNPTTKDGVVALNKMGVKPKVHLSRDIEIQLVEGDTVVMNTVAHSVVLKNGVYAALENGKARKLVWFVHEDNPDMFFGEGETKRVRNLLEAGKIVMFIAAKKTLQHYQKAFGHKANIRLQPYKYEIAKRFQKVRTESDFNKLSFILPGTVGDGRKGQLPIMYALAAFARERYAENPKLYRDFELVYVGMSTDFLSRQILEHAPGLFGKRFKHYGHVSHDRSCELIMQSNITVCYSLGECLPLFVFEGMTAGHPILRNDSSGVDEQLFEGKNGFALDSKNFTKVIETFETVLNKQKTTNKQLADMSAYSHKIALQQADNSYDPMLAEIFPGNKNDSVSAQ